jgi:ferredoxin-NADP reductase
VLVGTRLGSGSRFTRALAAAAAHPGDRGAFRTEPDRLPTDLPRATFHVSGSPAFVRDTTTALAAAGIPRRQVRKEAFRGY